MGRIKFRVGVQADPRLGETGLLAWDKTLAALTLNSGRAIMVLAMVWGAWLLWRGWRRQRG